ncbi:MAG: methylated-DNA--[protein]-cysteine S-methyltransferase [Sphingobacteriia bacterium]|nr:methylated-DNA--[protein]-cysteine S-methyltransferase [Sphingobacteriia bacterium]NCC38508.1 methylated-DNA--[protein]-cysteine S-methyltransferase [Gammaproteobacteria bacterium]
MPRLILETPFGPIGIRWDAGEVLGVELDPALAVALEDESAQMLGRGEMRLHTRSPEPDPFGLDGAIRRQLGDYLSLRARGFTLPVRLEGTTFQRRVWDELVRIPFGQTLTYGVLARRLGSAPRAVGQACRANPCPILVPCHRVVAACGLGGFAGDSNGRLLAVKRWLLNHEGVDLEGVG